MKNWLVLYCLLVALGVNAQTVVTINQLHDTLQPKVVETNTRKSPNTIAVPKQAGGSYVKQYKKGPRTIPLNPPTVTTFAPNVAQGQAFFTTYTSDDGLAMDAINWGKTTVCDSEGNIWFATQ
jgi:hypothetical protein